MSLIQYNNQEKYAWVDQMLEWSNPDSGSEEELNRETFGPVEESVEQVIPMEVEESVEQVIPMEVEESIEQVIPMEVENDSEMLFEERYAWFDEAIEFACSDTNSVSEEDLNRETFGSFEDSMEIDEDRDRGMEFEEKYAWVDEAIEFAWSKPNFEEDEELNRETFGLIEESIDDTISELSLDAEETFEYEDNDFSVSDVTTNDKELKLFRQSTVLTILNDGTVIYNGYADGRAIHSDDEDDTMKFCM